jgi:predicted Fe-Mo cluster-binding NifX family protein
MMRGPSYAPPAVPIASSLWQIVLYVVAVAAEDANKGVQMKVAIPVTQGALSSHFGHCEVFAVFQIEDGKMVKEEMVDPPIHEPGSHPKFLHEIGVSVVISGGMGMKAQELMHQNGIEVIIGVCPLPLRDIVEMYLQNKLESGENRCEH